MRQIDKFCELLDKLEKIDGFNKQMLMDAFHKANPNSLEELMTYPYNDGTKLPDLHTTTYTFNVKLNQK